MKNNKFVDEKTFLEGFVEFLQDLKAEETLEELIKEMTNEDENVVKSVDLLELLNFLKDYADEEEEWRSNPNGITVTKKNGEYSIKFDKPIKELIIAPLSADFEDLEFEQVSEFKRENKKSPTIVSIIGCSSSGKDAILKEILRQNPRTFKGLVSYTTRPMREGEVDGREYHFVSKEEFEEKLGAGEFVEYRTYKVEGGDVWYYGLHDSEVDTNTDNIYVGIFDINGYWSLVEEYGEDNVFPVYINCDVVTRLSRALAREDIIDSTDPKYREVLRRLYADSEEIEQYIDEFDTVFYNGDCSIEEFEDRVDSLIDSIVEFHKYK